MTTPLWLTKVGHFFELAWTWLKGHWYILVILAILAYSMIFAKRKADQYDLLMKEFQEQMRQNHADLEALRKIQQDQIAAQQAIDRKYQEVISKIEKDYNDQLHLLDSQKEKELRDLIAANKDNPDTMAREINSLFGIPIYQVGPNS